MASAASRETTFPSPCKDEFRDKMEMIREETRRLFTQARFVANFGNSAKCMFAMSSLRGSPDPVEQGIRSKMTERRSRVDERTAYQEGLSLPFSLFLRGKKRVEVRSGEEEEGEGGGRSPIQRSTRPVGMECRYESSPLLHSRLFTF